MTVEGLRSHLLRAGWAIMLVSTGFILAGPRAALAISPTPNASMTDVNSSSSYPSGYGAGIIEALGMIGSCSYYPYRESDVEAAAVSWINAGHNTIIEVTPQTGCDGREADYQQGMENVYLYVQSHVSTSAFNQYFGGFMVDEEPYQQYWYVGSTQADLSATATAMGNLNNFLYLYLDGDSLGPYSEIGDAPGWWTQSEYNTVAFLGGFSTPAPQIYNTNMVNFQNSLVGSYGTPTLITCHSAYLACSTAETDIHGSSFEYSRWGTVHWLNVWNAS